MMRLFRTGLPCGVGDCTSWNATHRVHDPADQVSMYACERHVVDAVGLVVRGPSADHVTVTAIGRRKTNPSAGVHRQYDMRETA